MPTVTAPSSRAPFASKRLATDAKIVLEKRDYKVNYWAMRGFRKPTHLCVLDEGGNLVVKLNIFGGCVDNAEVEKLLEAAK